MESLVSTTSTASRDILAEELTNLRSLLRLNADGIGDEADLISQLNQLGGPFPNAQSYPNTTRAAIDQFYTVLCERRDLLVTPETLPPGSPTSSIATSPRLSLDSLPASWRSSRTSQLSFSIGGGAELPKKLGLVDELGAAESTENGLGIVEDWHFEMNPLMEDEPAASENGDGREDFSDDVEDGNMDVQDEAFKRLSDLLASLQSQAEAAISNPKISFNDDGAAVDGIKSTEEYRFPMLPKPKARKRISLRESDVHSFSSPKSDQLLRSSLRASFRRTNSLPYVLHTSSSISSISSMLGHPRIITTDSCGPGTGEHTPLSPINPSNTESIDPLSNGNHTIHRRVNSASLLSLPLKRYSRSLMSSPPPSGLSTAIHSGCSSPRSMSMSRRGSYLIKDMGIESLLGELIDMGNRANQTVLEHQGFMAWVWALLAGVGALWLAVGWALKWNCQCQCPTGCPLTPGLSQ
ncbi:hypothetical protein EV426DRAFT_702524 [Tirmania nivea]|nr:hypothetical protein EV426DRAFT_702524 [Tirmania nivea]